MKRNSLLDYLADNDAPELQPPDRRQSDLLLERLEQLEGKLAALGRSEQAAASDHGFSSQIEAILRRQREQLQPVARQSQAITRPLPPTPVAPTRQPARLEMPPPPLALDLPAAYPDRATEFAKFVEAVRLIGHAANRFLPEPPPKAPERREPLPASEDTIRLTAALRETVAAFQAMTSELGAAAGQIRRSSEPARLAGDRDQASPRLSREDAELLRLQDELDQLRERLGAMARRGGHGGY